MPGLVVKVLQHKGYSCPYFGSQQPCLLKEVRVCPCGKDSNSILGGVLVHISVHFKPGLNCCDFLQRGRKPPSFQDTPVGMPKTATVSTELTEWRMAVSDDVSQRDTRSNRVCKHAWMKLRNDIKRRRCEMQGLLSLPRIPCVSWAKCDKATNNWQGKRGLASSRASFL